MITVLLIVAYLTNGTPLPTFFIVDNSKETCGAALALEYTRRFIVPSLTDAQIQTPEDTMRWQCLPVPEGTPGPAMRHIPQDDEA